MSTASADTSATEHHEEPPSFLSTADQVFSTAHLHQSWYKAQNDHHDNWLSNSAFHRHLHLAIDVSSFH